MCHFKLYRILIPGRVEYGLIEINFYSDSSYNDFISLILNQVCYIKITGSLLFTEASFHLFVIG